MRKNAIGCAQQCGESDIDEINIREREDQLGVEHHALVDQVVDDVEQRGIRLVDDSRDGARGRPSPGR